MTKPGVKHMPAIIRFLGYNPLPPQPPDSWGERIVRCRTAMGITHKEVARQMGVDQGTLARWERGELKPMGAFAARAVRFLEAADSTRLTETARIA